MEDGFQPRADSTNSLLRRLLFISEYKRELLGLGEGFPSTECRSCLQDVFCALHNRQWLRIGTFPTHVQCENLPDIYSQELD